MAPSTPVDSNAATNTVAEGAANGSTVGVTVSSSDVNGPAVTYSLTGDTSGGGFTINAATGVITVADASKLDYESAAGHAYTVTAQASDGTLSSSQTFTIGVTDVAPSTPVDSNAATNTVAEGAANGSTVGVTVSSSDVNGPAVTYSLTGDTSGGGFTINAATGVITVADASKLDYESAAGHAYTVTAQASDGTLSSSQTFTIGVTDVAPSTPVDSNAATNTVAEGAANGSTVGVTVSSSDVNGPAVTYSLTGDTSGGGFTINAATGVITVADASKLDYESAAGHAYTVTAQASDGTLSSSQTFTIGVTDVAPSTPVDSNAATNTVAEGAANGSTVGVTVSSSDVNGPAVTYSLTGDTSGGGFTINAATGVITVADASKLDYESAAGHAYTVTAQASDGTLSSSQTFTINVTDVAPIGVNDTSASAGATAATEKGGTNNGSGGANGTGNVLTNDTDINSTSAVLSVASFRTGNLEGSGTAGTLGFGLIGAHGTLTLNSNGSYSYVVNETDASVQALNVGQSTTDSFNYTVSDGSLTDTAVLTVTINGANDAPVNTVPGSQNAATINTNVTFSAANGNAISISDVDVGAGTESVSLTVGHGVLTLATTAGLSGLSGNGTGTVTFTGTVTNINNALNGLVYNPADTFTGTDTLAITTTDTGGLSDSDTVNIVEGTNAAALTTGPDTVNFVSGTNSVTSANTAGSITLTNGDNLTGGSGSDTLSVTNTGTNSLTSFSYTIGDGAHSDVGLTNFETLSISGTGSNGGHSIDVSFTFDANYSNGGQLTVDATGLSANINSFVFNAGAVTAASSSFAVTGTDQSSNTLIGGAGNDTLVGGSQADLLVGGGGNDTLTGNGGADQFRLRTDKGTDTITDYTDNTDKIGFLGGAVAGGFTFGNTVASSGGTTLSASDLTQRATISAISGANDDNQVIVITGSQNNSAITTTTVSGATNLYVIVLDSTTGKGEIWFDSDWGDTANRVQVATLNNVTTTAAVTAITNTDIVVYNGSVSPAGIAGEPINLGLVAPPGYVDAVTAAISGVPAGWTLSEGSLNADGTWSVQTNDVSTLSITAPAGYVGALALQVTLPWIDPFTDSNTLVDNVEAYAPGSPIFAWSGNDHLTGSSGHDTFVFSQPIGNDVVHGFEVSSDVIDLISYGWQSFSDVQAHTADDANGNAVVTLADGQTITLDGVHTADLTAANFEFDVTPTVENPGAMTIGDGAMLPLSGVIHNTGEIDLQASGDNTLLQLIQTGITLNGGGHVVLSDDDHNVIAGTVSNVTLDNVDNVISGAGQIGQGSLTLSNEGIIDATGTHALVIDTGANVITNAGTLEATGAGGLVLASAVANSGLIWANGGAVAAEGEVTGSGNALISGAGTIEFGAASAAGVTFDVTAAGHLILDDAFHFSGTVSGLDGNDDIDIKGISFGAGTTLNFTENQAGTGGTLTVSDGAHTANIVLLGQYDPNGFAEKADTTNGTVITYDPHHIA
nr:hypothetical protein G6P99_00015 [Bradyrhizobium sp. 6(2017)]